MATRGKEIQDFIKSQKKTARERFEEVGWKYSEFKEDGYDYLVYYKYSTSISFSIQSKTIEVFDDDSLTIDMETLKLINYQVKELGWL